MRSARGWWVILGCVLVIFIGNVCLVLGLTLNDLKHHQNVQLLGAMLDSCCSRHEKSQRIEHGTIESVDVGRCRKACRGSRGNLLAVLLGQDNSTESTPDTQEQSCPEDWLCRAARSRMQRVSTLRGLREVAVVETCECHERPAECKRITHNMVFNPGTPYETLLDIGTCAGHCRKGGCQPFRSRTVSVAGPTGAQCHSVIESCSCASQCYRQNHLEAVYDYSDNTTDPVLKEVDVGRCAGTCSGLQSFQCADPFHRSGTPCKNYLYSTRSSECAPSGFTVQQYTTREGSLTDLMVIQGCVCN